MSTQKEKLAQANKRLMGLFKADQKSMMAFKTLSDAAVREGNISTATKEMIAVAIAAARGCEDCILYHVNEAKSHGADRDTLIEILAVAIEMSGGPGTVTRPKRWTPLITFDDITAFREDNMKTGSRLPSTPVQQLSDGGVHQIDLAARSAGKTLVLVAVPGAFTPTCSDDHVPGYLRDAQALRAAGVDEIIILATSDFFVVKAWSDRLTPPGMVQFAADGGLGFTRAFGQVLDLTELGLGPRTQRYAAIIRDGDVVWMAVEPDAGAVTVSGSANVLTAL